MNRMTHPLRTWMEATAVAAALLATTGVAAAQIEPEERGSATVRGVHVSVVADAWTSMPPDIGDIEPLLVTIDNASDVPLRIRYDQFAAVGPTGDRQPAVPPREIRGSVWVDPYYGGAPYPYYGAFYPGYRPFGFYGYDPWYYPYYYTPSVRVGLPTQEMLLQALPEGVLPPGRKMSGFVYLADDPDNGDHSTFLFELVNAVTGEPFGRIAIPLEID